MGLFRALGSAAKSTLADQWLEMFYCDALDTETIVTRGKKRDRSGNNKGNDNIISNGSRIVVNEGQCALIIDQGKISEVCAEAGEYIYDASTEPSIFCGSLGKGIKDSFKTFGRRFAAGGEIPKEQRVYYFNTKEFYEKPFGTNGLIPYQMTDIATKKSFTVNIRCRAMYSYRLADPILFYTNVCGNITEDYTTEKIDRTFKSNIQGKFQKAISAMSIKGYDLMQLTGAGDEVVEELNRQLAEEWVNKRGIELTTFNFEAIDMDPASQARFNKFQEYAAMSDPNISLGMMAQAQAEALKTAAGNKGGAMMGFAGLNMAQGVGGNMMAGMAQAQQNNMMMNQQMAQMQQAQQPQMQQPQGGVAGGTAPAPDSWKCECGTTNTGKFCLECGKPKPAPVDPYSWQCECGASNKGKFCQECGKPKPAGAKVYKCDKCGWEPTDKSNPPKFCPQCGDRFDDNDIVQ